MAKISIRIGPLGDFKQMLDKLANADKVFYGRKSEFMKQTLAEKTKDFIADGIEKRRPEWAELSEITKTVKGHDKILVDTGSFKNAMVSFKDGKNWVAGLPEGAVGSKGQDLNDVGIIHEEGAMLPITDAMRNWFEAKGFPLRNDTKFIRIPPRPWFEPAVREIEAYSEEALDPIVDSMVEDLG